MGFTNEFQIRFSISYINTVSATGGTAGADGSDGRIAIYYSTSFSGTANNAYLRNMSEELVDSIFLDGFESGDLSAWSSAQTDGGDLMASQSADYWGDYGLAASINDTNAIYVQDDTPDGEGTFHARFYINPDGLNMGAADILPIFQGLDSGGSPVMKVEINNPSGSAFQVRVNVLEGSTWVPGSWQSLPGGWTAIEIDYKTTHELGFSKLYINGNQTGSVSNINNPDHQLHSVRLGAVSIPSGTTSGVLYFDDYESRRYSTIGLLPDRGVEDPEAVQEAGWAERVYSYQRSQPFAVQQVTTEEGTSTYDYDANGRGVKRSTPGGIERGNITARMENGVSWTHTYNAENRLASMTDGVTTWLFSYDGDGTLVGQLVTDNVTATHTAFFMGGGYEVISDGVTETVRKYYALAAPLAALGCAPLRYARQTFGMSDNGVMKYLISDHLGSTVAITDITGNILAETRYAERSGALRHFHVLDQVAEQPFGEPRADAGSLAGTDKTYTGQRDVPDTGLMDYRARHYSPWLGRFIQPDAIVPGAGNSQAWNRFTYGLNNPIKYLDPSGNRPCNEQYGCEGKPEETLETLFYEFTLNSFDFLGKAVDKYGVNLPRAVGSNQSIQFGYEEFSRHIYNSPNYKFFVTGFDNRFGDVITGSGEYSITKLGKGWIKSLGRAFAGYDLFSLSIGYLINISPNIVENSLNNHTTNRFGADLIIDTGGFITSEITEKAIALTFHPLAGFASGLGVGAVWDTISKNENWSGKITYHYNQVDLGIYQPYYSCPNSNIFGATH